MNQGQLNELTALLATEQAAKEVADKEDLRYIVSDNRNERYRAHKTYEKSCGKLRDALHNHAPALLARLADLERLREAAEREVYASDAPDTCAALTKLKPTT